MFLQLSEDRFFETVLPSILLTAKGMPDLGTRAFLHSLTTAFPHIPVLGKQTAERTRLPPVRRLQYLHLGPFPSSVRRAGGLQPVWTCNPQCLQVRQLSRRTGSTEVAKDLLLLHSDLKFAAHAEQRNPSGLCLVAGTRCQVCGGWGSGPACWQTQQTTRGSP